MGIFLAAWLAAAARTEMTRFIEFMHFLRYGTKLLPTLLARRLNDRYFVWYFMKSFDGRDESVLKGWPSPNAVPRRSGSKRIFEMWAHRQQY